MAGFFDSIPEPEPELHEVTYNWLPLWAYHLDEIQDIKDKAVSYTHSTYTILEPIPKSTLYFL